jgi:hypothetical protein
VRSRVPVSRLPQSVSFLVTHDTKRDQILGRVIAEAAPRLDVMDLKIFRSPTGLTMPAVSLEDFIAELAISHRLELQARPFGSNSSHDVT